MSVIVDGGPQTSGMMDQLLRVRSSRVIAGGRLAISFFVLGAVWLDPSEPTQLPQVTYTILILYAALSTILFYAQRLSTLSPTRLGLPTPILDLAVHILEMGVFGFLLYATNAVTGPFFPLFTFSIVGATFRWGWKGALWTSVVVLVLLILAPVVHLELIPAAELEIDRLMIRCAHVVVIGGMLTYFAFHQQRAEGELFRLSSWDPKPLDLVQLPEYVSSCARYVADVFAASRVIVVIQDKDEPWASSVHYENGSIRQERILPGNQDVLVPMSGENALLLGKCTDTAILAMSQVGSASATPTPESFRKLCAHVGADHLLTVSIQSDLFHGRLLVLDRPDFTAEEMMTATLVARQIESGLGRLEALDALRRAAASEERLRMARDLHDGVLQTLSAAAMHLEVIRRSPSENQLRMAALQDWLHKEQRELRRLIERLRNDDANDTLEPDPDGSVDLVELVKGIEARWGIPMELSCSPPELHLSTEMSFQLQQIIREAAANAVRHGGATKLIVMLVAKDDRLEIQIDDNGKGLDRHGAFDSERCSALGIGPRNLHERVAALNGSFRLHSRPQGLQLEITLPMRPSL